MNLMPYLTGEKRGNAHQTFFWRQGKKTALRMDQWKLIQMKGDLREPKWELYHLESDPTESMDLSTRNLAELESMLEHWQRFQSEMREPLFQ